jgi:hypothetical protein
VACLHAGERGQAGPEERLRFLDEAQAVAAVRDSGFDFLERLDSTTDRRRECSYRYRRDSQGNLTEERALEASGRLVWRLHYTSPMTAQYTDPQGFPTPRTPSGAAYVRFVWSEEGWPREIWHLDRLGRPAPDRNGSARLTFGYNAHDHEVDQAAFDLAGKPVPLQVVIDQVTPALQADRLGLQRGDVLVKYAGNLIRNGQRFLYDRWLEQPGEPARDLEVLRRGTPLTVAVSPGALGVTLTERVASR